MSAEAQLKQRGHNGELSIAERVQAYRKAWYIWRRVYGATPHGGQGQRYVHSLADLRRPASSGITVGFQLAAPLHERICAKIGTARHEAQLYRKVVEASPNGPRLGKSSPRGNAKWIDEVFPQYMWTTEDEVRVNSRGTKKRPSPTATLGEKKAKRTCLPTSKAPLAKWQLGFLVDDPPQEAQTRNGRVALCYRYKHYRVFFPKQSKDSKPIKVGFPWKRWGGWRVARSQAEAFYELRRTSYTE